MFENNSSTQTWDATGVAEVASTSATPTRNAFDNFFTIKQHSFGDTEFEVLKVDENIYPKSTIGALLRHNFNWQGNDSEEILSIIKQSKSQIKL